MSKFTNSIIVTGGTVGLGKCCAQNLAKRHPESRIVIASRTDPESAATSINTELGQDNVQFVPLDLGSKENIRLFSKAWEAGRYPPVRSLILNAGLQVPGVPKYTKDGIELTFGVNHVGHVLLFSLLQPYLADEARIVVVSSGTHDPSQKTGLPDARYTTAEELAHPSGEALNHPGRKRYSTSKLANILWTYALDRRLQKFTNKRWTVVAFDPGLMPGTGLLREGASVARVLWKRVLPRILPLLRFLISPNINSPEESGQCLAWVSDDEQERKTTGVYYEGRKQIPSSIDSHNEGYQEDLWSWTIKFIAESEAEAQRFEFEQL